MIKITRALTAEELRELLTNNPLYQYPYINLPMGTTTTGDASNGNVTQQTHHETCYTEHHRCAIERIERAKARIKEYDTDESCNALQAVNRIAAALKGFI